MIEKKQKENELWPEDESMLEKMKENYVSENEKVFFEMIREKMLGEYAPCGDLLLSAFRNQDCIFLERIEYSEFVIGSGKKELEWIHFHVMSLSEVLNANLKEIGLVNRNVTLLEWLREIDYDSVKYDQNKL